MKSTGVARKPTEIEEVAPRPILIEDKEQQVRIRAHQIYEERGFVDGCELDDWLQAEAELAQEG